MNINSAHELKNQIDGLSITAINYSTVIMACDDETSCLEIRFELYNMPFETCNRLIEAAGIKRNRDCSLDYRGQYLFADIYSDDNGLTLRIY